MTSITARTARILAALNGEGADTRVVWASSPKPAAAHKGVVLSKVTSAIVRSGVEYASMVQVQEAIAAGERGEVQSLPWGEWIVAPYIIGHKGTEYLRLTPSHGKPVVSYFVDGEPVDGVTFRSYLTPSARAKAESGDVPLAFTVKCESVRSVGGVTLAA